jgi:iron complex outermembrane recepter protein
MSKVKMSLMLILMLLVSAIQAQISGKIIDASTKAGIANAQIRNNKTNASAVSSANGDFIIAASTGDEIEVAILGYDKTTQTVSDGSMTFEMKSSNNNIGQVVVTGTRRLNRVQTESAVPIDVIQPSQLNTTMAKSDITSILNTAAPSLNANKQSGSDGADHIDLATLRGLGPDQTLVLVNGKRRHQTAFVALYGTRGRGNSGTDLSAIPVTSIDRVEILRDGASAQYGSDAIAGVINIILKKKANYTTVDMGLSGYLDNKYNPATFTRNQSEYIFGGKMDGVAQNLNLNTGFVVGNKGGFINLGGSLLNQNRTYRQSDDTTMPVNVYRRAYGDGELFNASFIGNLELPINEREQFYAFGGYSQKEGSAYAYSRNYSTRPGRFPYDAAGLASYKGDIIKKTDGGDYYYNPLIETKITDESFAAGFKGLLNSGWNWDVSNAYGKNTFHFFGNKTFNAGLGPNQTRFDDGGFSFMQNTINANMGKEFKSIMQGLHFAFGGEFRFENYSLVAGEANSYKNFDTLKATGSQGFPGYQPGDEVSANRNCLGLFTDVELDVTKKWMIAGALRFENYSDFGATLNYKLATRYKVADNFNVRGSMSSGFRAPSLQQMNFSSTFTNVQGSLITEVKLAPNYSDISKAAGIPALKQERSMNFGLGFTVKPVKDLTITVDGYLIKVRDRVVLSGLFSSSDTTLGSALTSKLQSAKVDNAQFFANAVNTTNMGLDFVVDYAKQVGPGKLKLILAANVQTMKIDSINVPTALSSTETNRKTFLSDREQKFILASAPGSKANLTISYDMDKFAIGLRINYFGAVSLYGYGTDGSGINPMVSEDTGSAVVPDIYNYGAKFVPDLFLTYKPTKMVSITIGVDNFMNVHPDVSVVNNAKGWAYNNEPAGLWDAVQMGINGRRMFAKVAFNLNHIKKK